MITSNFLLFPPCFPGCQRQKSSFVLQLFDVYKFALNLVQSEFFFIAEEVSDKFEVEVNQVTVTF